MKRLRYLVKRFFGLFPSRLPIGMTEFKEWADSVLELAKLPANDSMYFALATAVLHADSLAAYKSKEYFVRTLLKGAANQIAAAQMQELKERQIQRAKEEAARQAEEKTEGFHDPSNNASGAV